MPRCEPLVGKSLTSFCKCGHVVAIHTAERQCPACDMEAASRSLARCPICLCQTSQEDLAEHKRWHHAMSNLERV